MAAADPHLKETDTFELDGYEVTARTRMTENDRDTFEQRARELLALLEKDAATGRTWPAERLQALARHRVGVTFKRERDPLYNGAMVTDLPDWFVLSVIPHGPNEVTVRFERRFRD